MIRYALALALFFVISCAGNGPPVAAPLQPSGGQAQWIAAAFGSPADASVMLKPVAARSDPYWGPLLNRVLAQQDRRGDFISHGAGQLVLNSQQIDLHVVYRDPIGISGHNKKADTNKIGWLGVIYGALAFDPLTIRDADGRPLFSAPFRLPSGVLVFFSNPNYGKDYGAIAPSAFYLPSGVYIVSDQATAPRVQQMLAANPAPPPALQATADSLGGITFGVTSLRFVDARAGAHTAVTQGMTAAGFGLRGGSGGAVEGYATYATNDDAERGYAALQRECAQSPDACYVGPGIFRDARASRDGDRITIQLAFTEKLLSSLQTQSFE